MSDAALFVESVNRAIADGGYDIVFSCDDPGVYVLSQHRDAVQATVPYGPHSSIVNTMDKLSLMREAGNAGLGVPWTAPAGDADIEMLSHAEVVVKPRFTFVEGADDRVGASIAQGAADIRATVDAMRSLGAEPLIQERLDGRLVALTALTDRNGKIVARAQQVADITWPVGAGVSARAHTVAVDEALAAKVAAMLQSLEWFGLANIQFILGADGVPMMLDLNGRFYGSLALAVAAGSDFPGIWAALATGQPTGAACQARPGVQFDWLVGHLLASWSTSSGLGRLIAIARALARARGTTHPLWLLSDPSPAFAYYLSRKSLAWMLRS